MGGWTVTGKDKQYWKGILCADVFEGDGSQLTGITAGGGGTADYLFTTNDFSGTGNFTTTGEGGFGGLMPYDSATFDLGSVGLRWRNLIMSGDITTLGNVTCDTLNYTTLNPPVGGGGTADYLFGANNFSGTGNFTTTGTGTFGDVLIGAQSLTPLTDNSMADTLHRHSELSASDGTPDQAVTINATGNLFIGNNFKFIPNDGTTYQNVRDIDEAGIAFHSGDGFMRGAFFELYGASPDVAGKRPGDFQFSYGVQATTRAASDSRFRLQTRSSDVGVVEVLFCDSFGKVGLGTANPTTQFSVKEKAGISPIGGFMVKLTNKTGSNTVKGQLVQADTTANDAVKLTGIDEEETFGVFLKSGIAANAEAWVVISGIADVAMQDNTTATRGNWVRSSITEAGYADATNSTPPSPAAFSHFNEIGNCIETVTATGGGTHILARCVLHFN